MVDPLCSKKTRKKIVLGSPPFLAKGVRESPRARKRGVVLRSRKGREKGRENFRGQNGGRFEVAKRSPKKRGSFLRSPKGRQIRAGEKPGVVLRSPNGRQIRKRRSHTNSLSPANDFLQVFPQFSENWARNWAKFRKDFGKFRGTHWNLVGFCMAFTRTSVGILGGFGGIPVFFFLGFGKFGGKNHPSP